MEKESQQWTLGRLAEVLGATLDGPSDLVIHAPAQAESDNPHGLAFAESTKYVEQAKSSLVGAVIIPLDTEDFPKPALRHPHPRLAFGHLLQLFNRPFELALGVHPSAVIDPTATVHPEASVGAMAVVGAYSVIEKGTKVMPLAYIGDHCTIGESCTVMPHAVLVRNIRLGKGCEIGPGAVLGHAGFGYYWDGTRQVAIPQVGGVELGDYVDIGALTAVDRATADDTLIEEGTKIDNLVQVGHNVQIGKHGVFASQVGIAGSTKLGDKLTVAGQSGFADHIEVPSGTILGARSAVLSTIHDSGVYAGMPLAPMGDFMRIQAIQKDLPKLIKRMRALEKKVAELEGSEPEGKE